MARTYLTTQFGKLNSSQALTWTAIDSVNGNAFYNTGLELLLVLNTNTAGTAVVTVHTVPDPFGRGGGGTGDLVVTVLADTALPAAQSVQLAGQFPPASWNASDGSVSFDLTSGTAADVFVAVIRI